MIGMRITKTCKDCNEPFTITSGEIKWLQSKKLSIFERCEECRKKRRNDNDRQSD